jgi:hypothetical protein
MRREVVENFDTGVIGPIFVCCQSNEWSMKHTRIGNIKKNNYKIKWIENESKMF